MLPFHLTPAFKDYIWGGTALKTEYGKVSDLPVLAESWELSAHPDGSSIIFGGPLSGMPFREFVSAHREQLGLQGHEEGEFPILIKLIDAKEKLSVQVHPDDEYARRVEGEAGKTEMWVVLDCRPEAFLYYGVNRPVTVEELRRRIAEGTVTEILRSVPVSPGDVFFIPAGTLHAIGAGIVLAEIQQNSNSTYRVFDYNRLGTDGNPRPLHIEKALAVSRLTPTPLEAPGQALPVIASEYSLYRLAQCPYFTVDRLSLTGSYEQDTKGGFVSLLCTSGQAALSCKEERLPIGKGESIFIPGVNPRFTLEGAGEFLLTTV